MNNHGKMVYKLREGAQIKHRGDIQAIGEELEKLAANNQSFGPALVVKAAQNKSSVLHRQFDWDDRIAGNKWRLTQAQQLIKAIAVVQESDDDEDATSYSIRAFVAVEEDSDRGSYVPMGRALLVPKYREKMMLDAESELEWYQEKYQVLKSIKKFWNPLKLAKKELEARTAPVKKRLEGPAKKKKKKV